MHADVLEDRARRPVCARPSKGAEAQRLGAPGVGGADFDAAALWQDDQREHVCGGYFVCSARGGAEHLLDVQAHLAEAATNVVKFFHIICGQDLSSEGFKVIRQNMEEIVLQGGLGSQDVRVVNSYPSKVNYLSNDCMC